MISEVADCCKGLRLSHNIVDMAEKIEAETHVDFLVQLFRSELQHRENKRIDKLLNKAGFYSLKDFDGFRFDEVTLRFRAN
ncbi:MAG: ATP-binding protein, partial [Proteobacteria bacterium]|nr:ATP-binding protein [Pseudomonadota bacterium]